MVQYGCSGRRSRLADIVEGDDRLTGEPRSVSLGVVHLGDGARIPARVEDAPDQVGQLSRKVGARLHGEPIAQGVPVTLESDAQERAARALGL